MWSAIHVFGIMEKEERQGIEKKNETITAKIFQICLKLIV